MRKSRRRRGMPPREKVSRHRPEEGEAIPPEVLFETFVEAVDETLEEWGRGRRLCAHADQDGRGAHWLAPGEQCDQEETPWKPMP